MKKQTLSRLVMSFACALALSSAGCISSAKDDTKIGRGESFTSGDAKYDQFFQSVLDAQAKVDGADGEAPLKKALAAGLGVKASMATDEMIAAAKSKAEAMKTGGGGLYVQILPETKLFKKPSKEESEAFTKAVEKTVHDGIVRSDELSGIGTQIKDLEARIEELSDGAGDAFEDPQKKDEVVKELAAAKDVLERSRLKAYAESGRALSFVVGVVRAVDTGGFDTLAMAEAKPAPKPGWSGKAGKPGKPKPKQDFDP
jgi:hypothetical protein